jgi:hypothetical protein
MIFGQFTTRKSNTVVAVAAAMTVTVKLPAPCAETLALVAVASVPFKDMKTPEFAVTEELVITHELAAAAMAARPRGVLIVALPGVPDASVKGWTSEPPVPA